MNVAAKRILDQMMADALHVLHEHLVKENISSREAYSAIISDIFQMMNTAITDAWLAKDPHDPAA